MSQKNGSSPISVGTLDGKPLRGNVNRFPLPAPAPIPAPERLRIGSGAGIRSGSRSGARINFAASLGLTLPRLY